MSTPLRYDGSVPDKPLILGRVDGHIAHLVVATGLVEGIRKGQQKWVIGSRVEELIGTGALVEVVLDPAAAVRAMAAPRRPVIEPTVMDVLARIEDRLERIEAAVMNDFTEVLLDDVPPRRDTWEPIVVVRPEGLTAEAMSVVPEFVPGVAEEALDPLAAALAAVGRESAVPLVTNAADVTTEVRQRPSKVERAAALAAARAAAIEP